MFFHGRQKIMHVAFGDFTFINFTCCKNILPEDLVILFLDSTCLPLPLIYLFKKIFYVDRGAVALSQDPEAVLPLKLSVLFVTGKLSKTQ